MKLMSNASAAMLSTALIAAPLLATLYSAI
jgi:hypothetical protein